MTLGLERFLDCIRNTGLDGQVSGVAHVVRKYRRRETAGRPPRSFDRLLNVHAEVDHVHERLDGPLNLIVTAGAASDQPGLAVLDHQRALQRATRALAWVKGTRLTRRERIVIAAAVEDEAQVGHNDACAE